MVTSDAAAAKQSVRQQKRWNFGTPQAPISLDEFLVRKQADGFAFFEGNEPWLKGIQELSWQTFFRVCTEEMDDLSLRATKLVIDYCLGIVEELQGKIRGKVTLGRLEDALNAAYDEAYDNQVFHYRWARRHRVVDEALTKALTNRFPAR